MAKRITIMVDNDLDKKLRILQAKKIQNTTASVSYSEMINEVLKVGLKK